MAILSGIGKFKLIALTVAAVIMVIVVAIAFIGFLASPSTQVNEYQNDVQVNIGSDYPGTVDMINASIAKNQDALGVAIIVRDPISRIGENEAVQFDMVLILENDEDVLQTYEFHVDVNATGLFGTVEDAQTKSLQTVQITVDGSTLRITTPLTELSNATKAEWNICSTYEKTSNNQTVDSAWDFIPDQGLRTTVF